MSLYFDKERTSNCVIPLLRLAATYLLTASFVANFTLSKALLMHMLNFGLDLLVLIAYATFLDHIILPSAQNRLAMLQPTTKITPSNKKNQQNEIKTRAEKELSRKIKVVPILLCYL